MIQRIQSIFLLLAAGLSGGLLAAPFLKVSDQAALSSNSIFADQIFNLNDHIALLVLFLLAGGIALLSIFLFKNRKLQLRLSSFAILLVLGGLGFAAYLLYQSGAFDIGGLQVQAGLAFPILSIIFLLLANRAIKKDEKLVESSYSRLR